MLSLYLIKSTREIENRYVGPVYIRHMEDLAGALTIVSNCYVSICSPEIEGGYERYGNDTNLPSNYNWHMDWLIKLERRKDEDNRIQEEAPSSPPKGVLAQLLESYPIIKRAYTLLRRFY